jgi:PEP-CTERM motif
MKRNVRRGAWAFVVLGLLAVPTAAHATILPAGSSVSVSSAAPFTAGAVLNDTGSLAFSVGGTSGSVREWVVSNASSALCAGCLSFIYQVQVTQAPAPLGSSGVGRFAGSAYDAFTVDVTHISDAVAALGSVAGGFGANNADRDASGNTVGFNYTSTGGIFTGASFLEMANTNATASQAGIITVASTTGASQNFTGFAPRTSAVPEPATILLLGSSLVALGVWRRRS